MNSQRCLPGAHLVLLMRAVHWQVVCFLQARLKDSEARLCPPILNESPAVKQPTQAIGGQ
jgi:hypothetical protein